MCKYMFSSALKGELLAFPATENENLLANFSEYSILIGKTDH